MGGGTGSGLGVRLLSRITEQYPDSVRFTFSLFPNPSFGYNSAVEPYNTVLAMNYLIENASSSVCMDEGVAWRRVQEKPSRQGFECLAAQMMADVTACNRFTGQVYSSLFFFLSFSFSIFTSFFFFGSVLMHIYRSLETSENS